MRVTSLFAPLIVVVLALAGFAEVAWAKKVEIVISKIGQKMTVKVDGKVEYVWPVSTGASGYETPSGSFRPFRLEEEHFSKEWDDAPMPHSIFFTDRGHAIHGSYHVKSLGRRASHGCVRLAPENAKKLFTLVESAGLGNTRVNLKGGFFDIGYTSSKAERPKSTPWWLKTNKDKKVRSFAEVGKDIDKTVGKKKKPASFASLFGTPKKKLDKKPVKKVAAKKLDDKKVDDKAKKVADAKKPEVKVKKIADKCPVKDGKKVCPKA